jgi:hypothetical protein
MIGRLVIDGALLPYWEQRIFYRNIYLVVWDIIIKMVTFNSPV